VISEAHSPQSIRNQTILGRVTDLCSYSCSRL